MKSLFGYLIKPFLFNPSPLYAAGTLPPDVRSPGSKNLLIFAPGYSSPIDLPHGLNGPQNQIADHALLQFTFPSWMRFVPYPAVVTPDAYASLSCVTGWGNYGTVVIQTHGGYWQDPSADVPYNQVILVVGTPANNANKAAWEVDLSSGRLGIDGSGRFVIFPSFIEARCGAMPNSFFYLGACQSLQDNSLWNALKAKGAKVAFGWSDEVDRGFNVAKFQELIDPMLPADINTVPLTATQSYVNIPNKRDPESPFAVLQMVTASREWDNFAFVEGGLVNGDFETGFTGGVTGGDYNYRIVSGAHTHGGNKAAALGRWDTAYHGQDPYLQSPTGMNGPIRILWCRRGLPT